MRENVIGAVRERVRFSTAEANFSKRLNPRDVTPPVRLSKIISVLKPTHNVYSVRPGEIGNCKNILPKTEKKEPHSITGRFERLL